jgi:two-component system cell cycle response regulator DivK
VPVALIVDDNGKNRRLARDVLQAAGFDTLEAASGTEGITIAEERAPDVILMDLRLPDMNGAEAARTLKAAERTSGIPVVALSALPLGDSADWLAAAGFAGSLEKPIDVSSFSEQVRRYCSDAPG